MNVVMPTNTFILVLGRSRTILHSHKI